MYVHTSFHAGQLSIDRWCQLEVKPSGARSGRITSCQVSQTNSGKLVYNLFIYLNVIYNISIQPRTWLNIIYKPYTKSPCITIVLFFEIITVLVTCEY